MTFFFALYLILSPHFDVVDTRIRTRSSNVVNTRYSASPSNFPRGTSLILYSMLLYYSISCCYGESPRSYAISSPMAGKTLVFGWNQQNVLFFRSVTASKVINLVL